MSQYTSEQTNAQQEAKPMTEEQFLTDTESTLWKTSSTGKSSTTGLAAIQYIAPGAFAKLSSLKEDETTTMHGFRFGLTKDRNSVWRSKGGSSGTKTYYTIIDGFECTASSIKDMVSLYKGKLIQCVGFVQDMEGQMRFGFTVSEALNPSAATPAKT